MSLSSLIVILIILLFCTAFASASEMAIATVNRIRIKSKVEDEDPKAIKIYQLLEKQDKVITTIVVLNNIVNIIIPTLSTLIFIDLFPKYGIFISTILMTILILAFGEIIPKLYGSKRSEQFLYDFIGLIVFITKVINPIAFPFYKLGSFVEVNLSKNESYDDLLVEVEDEILTMIEESSLEGRIEENEEELIRNAIEFNDIRVSEILQPKRNVFMLNINTDKKQMLEQLTEMRYSRVPVYDQGTDEIIGVISEREFLTQYIKNENFDILTILRDVKFIPDTMKISTLLPELQNSKSHMAIVIDERATVKGIVTVEDILEELVGEIWDEHDDVVDICVQIDETTFEIAGEMAITDFNELYQIKDIQSEQSEATIAGYVIELAQKIPLSNEEYEDDNFRYLISEMRENKVEKIIVKSKPRNDE